MIYQDFASRFCPLIGATLEYLEVSVIRILVFSPTAALSNQELLQTGREQMDETDKTIERSRKVGAYN